MLLLILFCVVYWVNFMNKLFFKKLFYILFLCCFFLVPVFVLAQSSPVSSSVADSMADQLGPSGVNYWATFENASLTEIIANVISVFLSLLGTIFIILTLYGGFTWMTAQGDEAKIEKAKGTLQTAIIGLIIVVGTYSITYTIFNAL